MSDSPIDFAGLDAAATEVETAPVVETPSVETPVQDTGAETTVKDKAPQINPDGSAKETEVTPEESLPGDEKTPQEIRQALKNLRDADPKNASAVKTLHSSYERWNAAKQIFPKGVNEMKEAKAFMDTVGGHEGYEKLQEQVSAIDASDELLYAGSPDLIKNVVEDLKGQGKLDALGRMAPAFFDALKANDPKGYDAAFAPHFLAGIQQVQIPEVIDFIIASLAKGTPEGLSEANKYAEGAANWYRGLQSQAEKSKAEAVNPERLKLDEDRKAFAKQQEEFKTGQTKQFQDSVASANEKVNNKVLGNDLKEYLRKPFFKEYSRENLIPLGNAIKNELYATLSADKPYQGQMKAMWGVKNPDRAKIEEHHKTKLESIAADTVRTVVQRMYPGYAKGGEAAGRVAAAEVKKAATAKVDAQAVATGKPIYIVQKPTWESIDWSRDPKQYLYISGKAYLKGSNKLVTWRK